MVEAETSPVSATVFLHDYSHRLTGWAALFFFSTVALAAQVSDKWDDVLQKDDKFVITVMATSAGLSLLTILGYAIGRDKFAGGAIEGLFAVVCQLFWMIGMIIIMDPDRDIAVSKATTTSTFIRNANIYFFSWGSTIAIVYVLGRYALQIVAQRQNDAEPSQRRLPPKTNLWYLLTLASLVVLVDSIELFRAFTCPGEQDEDLCLATEFAISLGVVGTLFSFGCSVLATMGYMGQCLEFVGAMVMFAFYLTGVGLITFNDGPGTSLGNLYFAAWCGCGVAAVLLSRAYMDLIRHFHRKKEEPPQPAKPPADPSTNKVDFPDIEMGNDKQDKKDDDEGEPAWAKEDPEITVPPSKKSDKQDKEDGGEPSWAEAEAETESSAPVPPQKKSSYTEESIEMQLDKDVKLEPKEDTDKPIEKETKATKDDSGDTEKEDTKKSENKKAAPSKKAASSNKEASSGSKKEGESEQTQSKKADNKDSEKEDATTTISDSQKEQDEKSDESLKKEEAKSKATPAPKKRNSKRNSAKAKAAPKKPAVAEKEKAKADEGSGSGKDEEKLDQSEKEEKEPSTEKSTPKEKNAKADKGSGDGKEGDDDKLDQSEKEENEQSTEKSTSNETEDDEQKTLEDKGSF